MVILFGIWVTPFEEYRSSSVFWPAMAWHCVAWPVPNTGRDKDGEGGSSRVSRHQSAGHFSIHEQLSRVIPARERSFDGLLNREPIRANKVEFNFIQLHELPALRSTKSNMVAHTQAPLSSFTINPNSRSVSESEQKLNASR